MGGGGGCGGERVGGLKHFQKEKKKEKRKTGSGSTPL